MDNYKFNVMIDHLESVRIYAGSEFEKLCNNSEYIDACVFQSIRDSIDQNIQLLHSYASCKTESEV